jgi:hypothetical protein
LYDHGNLLACWIRVHMCTLYALKHKPCCIYLRNSTVHNKMQIRRVP